MTAKPTTKPNAPPSAVPAPSPAWDGPIEEASLVFLDLEMTGLDPTADRVIEVCAERVRGGVVEARIETLVRPEDGRFGNERIHGIRAEDLTTCETFAEIWPSLAPVLEGAVVVAHGASWDAAFLRRETERMGVSAPFDTFLDTLPVCRRAFPLSKHSLEELAKALALEVLPTHRAASDVATVRCLFASLTKQIRPPNARHLFDIGRAPRGPSPVVVESLRAAVLSGLPVRVTFRRAGKPQTEATMVVQRVAQEDDRPCVEGYLLPSRGRMQVRLDRILRVVDPACDRG